MKKKLINDVDDDNEEDCEKTSCLRDWEQSDDDDEQVMKKVDAHVDDDDDDEDEDYALEYRKNLTVLK